MTAKKKSAKKKSQAVAIRDPQQPPSPANALAIIIQAASNPSMPVANVERLYAIHTAEREKNERYLFDEAMRAVQAEMRPVRRDKQGERGWYATLDNISAMLDPIVLRHGFSLSYGSEPSTMEKCHAITCIVSHTGGHWRKYHLDLPSDSTGPEGKPNKTVVQGVISSTSYAKRALKQMIFNVTIQNADKDGNPINIPRAAAAAAAADNSGAITAAQVKELQDLANKTNNPMTRILAFVSTIANRQITTPADIPADCFERTVAKVKKASAA